MPGRNGARLLFALTMFVFRASPYAVAQAPDVTTVLDRATRQVTTFLDQVSDVKCTEQVTQEKLNGSGRPEYTEHATYDYLVLLSGGDDQLQLNESRIPTRLDSNTKNLPLLISNGLSTLFLIFHPFYRSSFRFEAAGEDEIGGEHFLRVHFRHIEGSRTPAALAVRGREYPLDLDGIAWIDSTSGSIGRIETSLQNDMRDVGLRRLAVQVEYSTIHLPGWPQEFRFPVLASVDVETLRQHWRNVHRFSDYKRFMVDTEEKVSGNIGTK